MLGRIAVPRLAGHEELELVLLFLGEEAAGAGRAAVASPAAAATSELPAVSVVVVTVIVVGAPSCLTPTTSALAPVVLTLTIQGPSVMELVRGFLHLMSPAAGDGSGVAAGVGVGVEPPPPPDGMVLLVNYGATAAGNLFGLSDWVTVIKDVGPASRSI